jgi:hypothetical protein
MPSKDEDLFDAVYERLLPHASYISAGDDDSARYFIPPEVFETLVWIVCNVAVPVLTGVSASIISDRLSAIKRGKREEIRALKTPANDLPVILKEIHDAATLPNPQRPTIGMLTRARDNVEEVLRANGFPAPVAAAAADEAINAAVETTWKAELFTWPTVRRWRISLGMPKMPSSLIWP